MHKLQKINFHNYYIYLFCRATESPKIYQIKAETYITKNAIAFITISGNVKLSFSEKIKAHISVLFSYIYLILPKTLIFSDIKKSVLHSYMTDFLYSFYSATLSGFSTCAIATFCIGIRQFLLLPNSTMTVSSVISITMP